MSSVSIAGFAENRLLDAKVSAVVPVPTNGRKPFVNVDEELALPLNAPMLIEEFPGMYNVGLPAPRVSAMLKPPPESLAVPPVVSVDSRNRPDGLKIETEA